jgi:hypothetical protein
MTATVTKAAMRSFMGFLAHYAIRLAPLQGIWQLHPQLKRASHVPQLGV